MTLLIYIFLSIEFLAAKVAQLIGKLVSGLQIGPDGRSIFIVIPLFHVVRNSLINITDKVELIATEFFQQFCDCLGYLEQHSKSCKSDLVGKYIYF